MDLPNDPVISYQPNQSILDKVSFEILGSVAAF
jgi:hypothetical protein